MLSSKDVENIVLEMQEMASETILNHISRLKTARTVNEQKKVIESFENIFKTNLKNSQSLGSEPPRLVFKRRFVPFAKWYLLNIHNEASANEIILYATTNNLLRKDWKYKPHLNNKMAWHLGNSGLFEICGRTDDRTPVNIWRLKK